MPDFRIWRQTRTGLLSYPVDKDAARAHLAATIGGSLILHLGWPIPVALAVMLLVGAVRAQNPVLRPDFEAQAFGSPRETITRKRR